MKGIDGNLGKYDLHPFEKGGLIRDDNTMCFYEWRLIHVNGDIYQIEYSPHESHIEELFMGRIKDVNFFWTLMRCFQEFDKTLRQHPDGCSFSIN